MSLMTHDQPGTLRDLATTAVGVDDTPAGWQALAWAAEEAAATGGRLLVCRVYPPGSAAAATTGTDHPTPAALELADPVLYRAVSALRHRFGGDRVPVAVRTGPAARTLLRLAGTAGELVLGAPRASGRQALLSVAGRLAAHGDPVIVVVRPVPDAHGPLCGHVVIGVDTRAAARAALEFGFGYADRHQLPVALVHVAADGPLGVWIDDTMLETHLLTRPAALDLLDIEAEPLRHRYPRVPVRRVALTGRPAATLTEAGHGARLLVLGRTGRSLLGATCLTALTRATCPVAIVPA